MPTIDYQFALGDTVYNIDEQHGIRDAVVKSIDAKLMYGNTSLQYTIAFKKSAEGGAMVDESTLFATADEAWAAYKCQILD